MPHNNYIETRTTAAQPRGFLRVVTAYTGVA